MQNRNIPFAVEEHIQMPGTKHTEFKSAEGKLSHFKQKKAEQIRIANDKLKNYYNTAGELADVMVGRLGKDNDLSNIIRNKRDSMALEASKGKEIADAPGE